mmetsp:Transcript_118552/g.230763  ORF Transcript_118552/g.230763 Transcript_118552/m.230763 type:complete len:85 (+) Transcript_118552:249-503(+)
MTAQEFGRHSRLHFPTVKHSIFWKYLLNTEKNHFPVRADSFLSVTDDAIVITASDFALIVAWGFHEASFAKSGSAQQHGKNSFV